MDTGGDGRRETVRYHQEFYANHELFKEGSWLHKPSPFVLRSLDYVERNGALRALDLGCGVGRHTLPLAERLPSGSYVVGMDLLPLAAERLAHNAADAGLGDRIQAVVADLDHVALAPESLDLLVSVSALEHSRDMAALDRLLARCRSATRPGGVHCLIMGTDKMEVAHDGSARPAHVELPLTKAEGSAALKRAYAGWEWLAFSDLSFSVDEEREGEEYTLTATNLRLTARRPRHA